MNTKTKKTAVTAKPDIYARVTDKIIESLENGTRPWLKPWSVEHCAGHINRPLRANGKPYNGVNILILWAESLEKGFVAPIWMTYKQSSDLGGQVRKGEHGSQIVYASTFTKEEQTPTGETEAHKIPFLKTYTVFNVEQIDGLPEHYYSKPLNPLPLTARLEHADDFFCNTGATIRIGGNRAYFSITDDYIQLPPFEAFHSAESHAATLAHEMTHWTRHPKRLDRDLGRKHFGDEGYAREELVAELGSAFLGADLGLMPEIQENHAAYIESWLKVLKNDKRFIFTAASLATKAVEYLHSLQPGYIAEAEPVQEAA